MPKRKNELLERRNALIVRDFDRLFSEGYRFEKCFEKLGDKYFLSPDTVNGIVWRAKAAAKAAADASAA
jgi:hypothetical protein